MTVSGDFIPGDYNDQEAGPAYPSAFGIQMTPTVIGAIVAVLGLAGAAYLFVNLVQPVLQKNDELKTQIAEEEAKVQEPGAIEAKFKQAQASLAQAKQKKASVTVLFANEQNLQTLLLDLNKRIENRNTALRADEIKAKLKKFEPDPKASGVVNDASFGTSVQNKLYREVYKVEFEGTFDQTRLIMLDLERLKPLLVVKNLKLELDPTERILVTQQSGKLVPVKGNLESREIKLDPQTGKPIPSPTRLLKTTFLLQALRPLTPEEQAKLQPPPSAASGQQQPAK